MSLPSTAARKTENGGFDRLIYSSQAIWICSRKLYWFLRFVIHCYWLRGTTWRVVTRISPLLLGAGCMKRCRLIRPVVLFEFLQAAGNSESDIFARNCKMFRCGQKRSMTETSGMPTSCHHVPRLMPSRPQTLSVDRIRTTAGGPAFFGGFPLPAWQYLGRCWVSQFIHGAV